MTRLLVITVFIGLAASSGGNVINVAPQRGYTAASINWIDDNGRSRHLSEFAGYPVILLPIYTRCPKACLQNVEQLKKALSDSSADPRQFRVLLFSFDSGDTAAMLANYRQREGLPLAWSLGSASRENIDELLESIGFAAGKAGTEFAHPNLLLFLDSKLRIAKWIYGNGYSSRDVDTALNVASGGSDWIGRHSDVLYALLVFAASICCVALSYYIAQLLVLRSPSRKRFTA